MAAIRLRDVVVEFPIYGGSSRSIKTTFMRAATGGILARDASDRVVVRALDGVTLDISEGDRVGLVGHNGSGKSTLLRVMAGAYEPVSGTAEIRGRVASMLSVSLGMEPEATGYENIFLRATVMGMKPREIEPLVQEVSEFAELGDYLAMPLRTYSSGMAMRLAFAVSTSVSADIILMDEWLSVGDASFVEKANLRLGRLIDEAKILVLASHSLDLVRSRCNKVVHLDHGRIASIEELAPPASQAEPSPAAGGQAGEIHSIQGVT
jgi:lipopolysaccharide transport system ATP-binding protein